MKGIYTDIITMVAKAMPEYDITIEAKPWKRGLYLVEKGQGFAIYPPYYHFSKRPYMWPYSLPMLNESTTVLCNKKLISKAAQQGKSWPQDFKNWPEDFYGLTIGLNEGFPLGGSDFEAAVQQGKIKVERADGNWPNVLKLGLGQIDCYLNDPLSIIDKVKDFNANTNYVNKYGVMELMNGPIISREYGFLGITDRDGGKYSYKKDFLQKFNTALYELIRDNVPEKIAKNYLTK